MLIAHARVHATLVDAVCESKVYRAEPEDCARAMFLALALLSFVE